MHREPVSLAEVEEVGVRGRLKAKAKGWARHLGVALHALLGVQVDQVSTVHRQRFN